MCSQRLGFHKIVKEGDFLCNYQAGSNLRGRKDLLSAEGLIWQSYVSFVHHNEIKLTCFAKLKPKPITAPEQAKKCGRKHGSFYVPFYTQGGKKRKIQKSVLLSSCRKTWVCI